MQIVRWSDQSLLIRKCHTMMTESLENLSYIT